MKNKQIVSVIFLIIFLITGCTQSKTNSPPPDESKIARNIILFIGDGMGSAHLYAGMTVSKDPFNLEKFPYAGFCKTYSADNYITDSAAGGTAIASGVKTNNGMIGVTPDTTAVASIIEIANRNGLSTGVISTSSVTHATPASFVAHNAGRGNYEDIANDFLNGTIDLFIGGGEDHFRNRKDGRDLTVELQSAGYDVVFTMGDLLKSNSGKIAGLIAEEHMPKADEGRAGNLEDMTRKAIEILSKNKNGFFLMVEGSMIDWGAHDKNIDYTVAEVIDFDKAIGVALDFASDNSETLIVVTADHETGGLTITGGDLQENRIITNFSVSSHTASMVPIFSFGPGAERFSGIHENTFFLNEFLNLLNISE